MSGGLTVEPNGRARAGVVLVQLAAVEEAVAALVLSAAWRHAAQRKSSQTASTLGRRRPITRVGRAAA